MIRLKGVTGAGFRSFANKFQIDDLPDNGLVSLSGKSGTGKSSFTQAVGYVLGTMDGAAKDQISWLPNAETMKVVVELEKNGSLVNVSRSSSGASMKGDQIAVEGAKALNAALPEFFNMDGETLALVTYRSQGRKGSFLSKSDADKKSMLWTLLGLSQYETALEKIKTDHLAAKRDADFVKSSVPREPGAKPAMPTEQFVVGEHSFSLTTDAAVFGTFLQERCAEAVGEQPEEGKQLEQYRDALRVATEAAARLQAEINAEYKAAVKDGTPELLAARAATAAGAQEHVNGRRNLAEANATLTRAKSVWESIQRDGGDIIRREATLTEQLAKFKERLEAHKKGVCPTCTQPWQNERELATIEKGIVDTQAQLGSIGVQQQALVEKVPRAQQILSENEIAHAKVAEESRLADEAYIALQAAGVALEAQEQVRQKTLWADVYEPRLRDVVGESGATKLMLEAKIASAQAVRNDWQNRAQIIKSEVGETQLKFMMAAEAFKHWQQMLAVWERDAKAYELHQTKLVDIDAKANLLSDVRDTMQGFLDRVVQDVLAEINVAADNLIALVPNVSRMGLVLGIREGRARAEIAAQISVDGQIVEYTQVSGGQQSVVELLTDLAIWEVVARYRGGVMPGWLVLDEPFDGMGPADIDACLDILERYAQERLIIVIHHATEFKKRFQKTYDFDWDVTGSTVKLST